MKSELQLLPERHLVVTGPVDHADWNFRPLLGPIQRRRFRLIVELLGERRFRRLLEVGYGSGVFLPELARHCDKLHGLDIHEHADAVGKALVQAGVDAQLDTGSASKLRFPAAHFDGIVAVSSLEYVQDTDAACRELRRVLTPDGWLVLVTPGHSWLADAGLRLLTGEDAGKNYANRRQCLRAALAREFSQLQVRQFPRAGGRTIRLYTAMCLAPRPD